MSILQEITDNKKLEVARAKTSVKLSSLFDFPYYSREINSFVDSLKSKETGIIAEFKRKSPSKGDINIGLGIMETTLSYANSGAAGLSILTDTVYFGGFKEDLKIGREANPSIPILRKDFMVDTYQIYEAKAWGADAILLIAASLEPNEIAEFSALAHELKMEVLLEIHTQKELEDSPITNVDIIGVNNRNLKNFSESNINASLELFELIPKDKVKISESCISNPLVVKQLKKVGYQGFLIGENFMKTNAPGASLRDFLEKC